MNKVLGICIALLMLTSCTNTETDKHTNSGFIVPDSCGDRWVCEGQCEEGYEWLCEPWEKK